MTIRELPLGGNISVEVNGPYKVFHPEVGHYETVPDTYTPWVTQRTNLFANPRLTSLNLTTNSQTQTSQTLLSQGIRWTIATTSAVGINFDGRALPSATPGRLRLRARANRPVAVRLRINGAETSSDYATVGTAWGWIDYSVTGSTAAANNTGLVLRGTTHVSGDWIEVDAVFLAATPDSGGYFDGNTASTTLARHQWTGTPDASSSVYQTRSVDVPAHPVWVVDTPAYTENKSGWHPVLQDATQLSITRGGALDGVTTKTDVGLATFTLKDAQDPMNGGTLLPGQEVQVLDVSRGVVYSHGFENVNRDGWQTWDAGGAVVTQQAEAHTGSYSMRMSRTSGSGAMSADKTFNDLHVGSIYTFSAWYKTSSSAWDNGPRLGVTGMAWGPTVSAGLNVWKYLTYTFVATSKTHTLRLGVTESEAANGTAVWDDISLTEVVPIFTGRIADLSTVYPMDKSNGTSRAMTQVTAADAVKVHVNTTRYGVETGAGVGFETFESRISRLSSTAQAPIEVPVVGAPREVYSF